MEMMATANAETATESAARECSHYRRGCRVQAACCQEWVGCRLCHNAKFPDHEIDRHAIRQMQCLSCETVQPCARECIQCKAVMGEYFCGVCNLFDDDGPSKQIFHCDDCGICRVGGRDNYYHCSKCCGCYPHSLNKKHRCVDGSMHRECAICLEVTFDSIEGVDVMPCGHVLHHSCWLKYICYGNVVCPTCRTRLVPSSDEEDAAQPDGEDDEESGDSDSGLSDVGDQVSEESDSDDEDEDLSEMSDMAASFIHNMIEQLTAETGNQLMDSSDDEDVGNVLMDSSEEEEDDGSVTL